MKTTVVSESGKKCVPTEKNEGPCHICVCQFDGVYHCRRRLPCLNNISDISLIHYKRKCDPNTTYQDENKVCTCNSNGDWRSSNCHKHYRYLRSDSQYNGSALRATESCAPNKYYLVDCNICRCGNDKTIDPNHCTTRQCSKGHKIDKCEHGDILRTVDEICACSDINYYIDRLCLSVSDRRIQRVNKSEIRVLLRKDKTTERLLPTNADKCTPNDVAEVDCNQCYCINGLWACTNKKCVVDIRRKQNGITRKRKKAFLSLPEVFNDKEKCVPRKKYRYKCNTCICTKKSVLSCTSMICLESLIGKQIPQQMPLLRPIKSLKYMKAKTVTSGVKKPLDLPDLPKGPCEKGKFYKKGCRKCYCGHDDKAVCAASPVGPKCKLEIKAYRLATPEDYGVMTSTIDITKLPALPNISTKCDPGHTYKVDCNICICLSNKNLLCTSDYCLSTDDMNRVEAKKRTGLPCSTDKKEDQCVQCRCVDGKLQCEALKDCHIPTRKRLHGTVQQENPRQSLNLKPGQECVPHSIYRDKCNRCYCQENGAFRCTAMSCLNYAQALSLQKSIKE
ncbi:uncharacterized protein LOC106135795 [Amyelois transitella]|uniref:uncharacterized protein LOC106135795 n=1 Tax=Amyelois transitella TaxID=680683 RepID=UPI00298FC7D3|nr:uncharacterized protein LOC106135795 [Amyelois transitella]